MLSETLVKNFGKEVGKRKDEIEEDCMPPSASLTRKWIHNFYDKHFPRGAKLFIHDFLKSPKSGGKNPVVMNDSSRRILSDENEADTVFLGRPFQKNRKFNLV